MKNIFKVLSIVAVVVVTVILSGCREDEPSSQSIFNEDSTPKTEFDYWILKNFTNPYNIRIIYRYVDKETNSSYNVVPTEESKARGMAIILRHVWLDAYNEVMEDVDSNFMKKYSPKLFKFIGSKMIDSTGKETLGDASGGSIINFTNVNSIDLDNPYVDVDSKLPSKGEPMDMNYWFFKTMHHEFCHILTQTKNYNTDFKTIAVGTYIPDDWHNRTDGEMVVEGFVSAYASSESNEDFAETYAYYVTHSETAYQELLTLAGETGADKIKQKVEFIRSYCNDVWGMDLDKVREVFIRRALEVPNMDLRTLD